MPKLTEGQYKAYWFIRNFIISEHRVPTTSELSSGLGYKSPNAAQDFINILKRKGYLRDRLNKKPSYKLANVEITIKDIKSE